MPFQLAADAVAAVPVTAPPLVMCSGLQEAERSRAAGNPRRARGPGHLGGGEQPPPERSRCPAPRRGQERVLPRRAPGLRGGGLRVGSGVEGSRAAASRCGQRRGGGNAWSRPRVRAVVRSRAGLGRSSRDRTSRSRSGRLSASPC